MEQVLLSKPLAGARRMPADLADRIFVLGGQWLLLVLLVLAVLLPLLAMLWRGFASEPGQGGGLTAAAELFTSANFRWLLGNSLTVSLTVAAIVVPLAYAFAYALQRTCVPAKGLWRGISLLPLLAPSILPGIALIYLFGNQGALRHLLTDNIYGFWGIVIGEAIYTFPHALMVLLSALALADARLFDAASSMGASPWRAFRSITWPGSRQGAFAAFCLVFTLCITDFGAPVVVGGDYQVLALEAYKAVVGQQQFGRGALIGMVLLLPALLSFAVDLWLRRRQREAMSGRAQVYQPQPSRRRDLAFLAVVLLICAALLGVFGMAMYSSLVKFWPYDLSLSLHHYTFFRTPRRLAGVPQQPAAGRLHGRVRQPADLHRRLPAGEDPAEPADPGPASAQLRADGGAGVGAGPGLRVFFFNLPGNPLHGLYGSLTLLVACTIAHFLTTAQLTASAALRQLDGEFEAAALSLKVPLLRHFFCASPCQFACRRCSTSCATCSSRR
nr:putative 2-aminoethylphosphonate ABC transporter permease subunit [Pseudomonas brassicacearum subsp. brassicacearum]